MAIVFNKILVPVDFSLNTETAVKHATALLGQEKTTLHLLHVVSPRRPIEVLAANNDLVDLALKIQQRCPGLIIKTHVLKGFSIQRMIIEAARIINPDLIVIGKLGKPGKQNRLHRWIFFRGISSHRLAIKTNCPVLTARPGTIDSRPRLIVIPIRDFLPEQKLECGILLARKYKAQVHLLIIRNNDEKIGLPQLFIKTYNYLREGLRHPIEFSSITPHELSRSTFNYAELILYLEPS